MGEKEQEYVRNPGKAVKDVGNAVVKGAKDTANAVVKGAKDTGKAIDKAVNDTGNYLSKDLGKDIVDAANYGIDAYGGVVEWQGKALQWVDNSLLNNNLDIYTGNLVSDYENYTRLASAIGEKTVVEDNVKAGVRVGAIVGAAVATGGATAPLTVMALTPDASNSSWDNLIGGLAKAGGAIGGNPITKLIGDTVNNIVNPADEVVNAFTGDTNPYPTTIIEPSDGITPQKVIPLIVIGVVLLTVASIATKKRKK